MITRETTVKGKIRKFSIEGSLFRKVAEKVLTPVDRVYGTFIRNIAFKNTKIIPNKIMFTTFQGEYTCNPKYICEELIRRGVDFVPVWMVKKESAVDKAGFPEGSVVVLEHSEVFFKELAESKIWIANSVDFLKRPLKKKKEQVMIETWHGSLGIKRFDANSNSGKGWVRAARITSEICDYLVSNSDFEDDIYRNSFWPNQEIWKFGHPRNDVLIDGSKRKKIKDAIHEKYGIDKDTKICLYAPTFRDSHTFNYYNIDYDRLIAALEKKFGGRWTVMLRFHPTVADYVNSQLTNNAGLNIKDATDHPDMQDLIVAADLGITDYSSWIFDHVLTYAPGFLYTVDLDDYYDERGFAYPLTETPFSIAKNNDELIEAIENFDEEEYVKAVDAFLKNKGCIEDGHASERVADKIIEILNSSKGAE